MNKKEIFTYFAYLSIVLASFCCINCNSNSENESNGDIESILKKGDKSVIISELKQNADIATTEVKIKKIAIYDSSKSEHVKLLSPSTWKYGERICIIPIEVTITYGYDLRDISIDDVKINDDSTEVAIFLPEPKIISAGYNLMVNKGSAVNITTGMRSEIGHELEEEVRKQGYDAVMKEDLRKLVGQDIENNAKTLIENIVKQLGWTEVRISTYGK